MRYRAIISYFGARYVGWQRQLNGLSVQEVLEKALEKTFGTKTAATASGRTDAGVHAEGQVVHFDADTSIPADKIPFAVNTHLPDDVSMLCCEVASDDFNARFNAKRKTYCYKMYISKHRRPMLEPTHEHVIVPVNLEKIKEACKVIEGTHDFKCFEASGSVIKNTVRTVYSIEVSTSPLQSFSCKFSVARFQNTLYVVDGKFADSDVQKRACDYAHHIVQKPVARDVYVYLAIVDIIGI